MSTATGWRPVAARATLAQRALLLARARQFFAVRDVLEVDTPALVNAPVSDPHLHSFEVGRRAGTRHGFLHTSPEFAMKRLLAAGSGDIYQICHVFRDGERSRLHNPEFTLIEWYRLGYTLEALMDEVAGLVAELLAPPGAGGALASAPVEHVSYCEAFRRELGLDPLTAPRAELERAARLAGLEPGSVARCDRDALLDVLMAVRVGPRLGAGQLSFVHRYPAAQAALAALDAEDPRVALRFELYIEGIELANGFRELGDAGEQRRRFLSEHEERRARGLPVYEIDEALLAALDAGLPAASGVALGFDRLLMLAAGVATIDEVLAFPIERA